MRQRACSPLLLVSSVFALCDVVVRYCWMNSNKLFTRLPGSPSVPKLLEVGVSSMARGEQAVISGTAADAQSAQSEALLPAPPADIERVELEVELLQFTQVVMKLLPCHISLLSWCFSAQAPVWCWACQVRDLTGDGHVMKRRVRDGTGEFPIDCPIEDSRVWVHYKCGPYFHYKQLQHHRIYLGPVSMSPW